MLSALLLALSLPTVMRHSSWETTRKHYAPGNVQSDAQVLQSVLAAKEKAAVEKPAG